MSGVQHQPGAEEVPSDLASAVDEHGRIQLKKRRRPWWQRAWVVLPVAVGLLLVLGAFSAYQVFSVRTDLLTARNQLGNGVARLTAGNAEDALGSFSSARAATWRASERLDNPAVALFSAVPLVGDSVRAARRLSTGAGLVAQAGEELSSAALSLPDGVGTLAPRGGAVPVDAIRQVSPALTRAHELVAAAADTMSDAPRSAIPRIVADAVTEFDEQLAAVEPQLGVAATMASQLPAFLGADEPRRYFFGAQNPAELRGTGGFLGAYTVLEADRGRLQFGSFSSIVDLTPLPIEGVEAPSEDYAARYDVFGGANFGQNANMTPHFPFAAVALQRLFEAKTGVELDGAIVADPQALAAMLEVVGEIEVEGLGSVDADSVVAQVTNEAYAQLTDSDARKELLGDVAAGVFGRFLAEAGGSARPAAEALISAAGGGHMLMHADDPAVQAAFVDADVAGVFGADDGIDHAAVIVNNAGQNKTDFYVDRTVEYEIWLRPNGGALVEVAVELSNGAPTSGQAIDVIGPNLDHLQAGENRSYISVYCAPDCDRVQSARDGTLIEPEVAVERDHPVFSTFERVSSGESRTISHRYFLPRAWDPSQGLYTLRLHDQPTIRPTRYEVTVRPPDGLLPARASRGVSVHDDHARWSGHADGRAAEISVVMGPPGRTPLQRLVNRLSEPAFTIGGG